MKITITILLFCLLPLTAWPQYNSRNAEEGIAVYYADDLHGQATSSGELYRRENFTAGHQYYPSGTLLRVARLDNGQYVDVRVNDKMAPDPERKIILSRAAAMQIGLIAAGKLRVRIEKTGGPDAYSSISGQLSAQPSYRQSQREPAESNTLRKRGGGVPTAFSNPTAAPPPDVVLASGLALAPGLSGYVIQLSSYDEGDNAVSYANQLLRQGVQHVYIWEKDGKNRVVVARFQNKSSAVEHLHRLRQQYMLDGIIVQLR